MCVVPDSQNLLSNVRALAPLDFGVRHWKDFQPNLKYSLEALWDFGCFQLKRSPKIPVGM